MASTNQSPFYKKAEEHFLNAQTDEERLYYLDEMIRECPKHKSSEAMLANLKTRRIKLQEKIERIKKSKKGGSREGIKKADMQAVLTGFTGSGKSSLLAALTNAQPLVTNHSFNTYQPEIGTMDYYNVKIQILDQPSLKSDSFDIGLVNNTDLVIIVIDSIEDIKNIQENYLQRAKGKKLIVFNKIDLLNENERRKIEAHLRSKKYQFIMVSSLTNENIENLKEKIFSNFDVLRIYLKEPYREPSKIPMIMKPHSTIKDVVNKISKQMINTIKEIHIWGPSSKFPNQKVGINHEIKDKDIIEFKTG
ncbi:MAG: GTPase [Candidatus Pacearchaeota archaeon]|jgi:hypothetical protein